MKQRQSMGGVGLLILMLLVIMFFSLKVPGMATERELSYPEFMVYLENKTVESAQIRPNREVPTGEVVFETTSGDREEFNVLDVKEVEMALRKAGVPYTTTSVRQDSYFMTVILPIALSAGVLIFLFMFINSRSGGGANAKMMNFGRSRARMVSTSKVNFTKVAGLEEEKEELEEIKEKICPKLVEVLKESGLDMVFFMLTNIVEQSTELLCSGGNARETVMDAFELSEDTEDIILNGVVSRKKQLIPTLVSEMQQ